MSWLMIQKWCGRVVSARRAVSGSACAAGASPDYTQDGPQVIRSAPENLDAILAGQAVFLPIGVHRGEVLEWPNRAAC